MREILNDFEEQLRLIERKIGELRELKQEYIPVQALDLFLAWTYLLDSKKAEITEAIEMLRKLLAIKTPSGGRTGDAA